MKQVYELKTLCLIYAAKQPQDTNRETCNEQQGQ